MEEGKLEKIINKIKEEFKKEWKETPIFIKTIMYATIVPTCILGIYLMFSTEKYIPHKFSKPSSYRIERHDVDQVFRDHNGYRIYWDNETGEVIEKKYFPSGKVDDPYGSINIIPFPEIKESSHFKGLIQGDKHLKIYKDLEEDSQGYVDIVYYTLNEGNWIRGISFNEDDHLYYIEIHLPKNKGLSPGNEEFGGKAIIREPMNEIK